MKNRVWVRGLLRQLSVLLFVICVGGCAAESSAPERQNRLTKAEAMFAELCRYSGEKIYRSVSDVDGIVLLKLRPEAINFDNQFAMDDPYGSDLGGEGYIESFVRGSFQTNYRGRPQDGPPRIGYSFVDVIDPVKHQRIRYTGHIERPGLTDQRYLNDYTRFVLDHEITKAAAPRYGVTYDDISTQEEREYWIAGSRLQVIDLETNEVLGERIGYMMDRQQGSRVGGRSPWLFAADNACPRFNKYGGNIRAPAFASQPRQTQIFVEKVLVPRH